LRFGIVILARAEIQTGRRRGIPLDSLRAAGNRKWYRVTLSVA
jgi:hypothetical protein